MAAESTSTMAIEADEDKDVREDTDEAEEGECESSGIEISDSRSSACTSLPSRSPRALATGDSADICNDDTVTADEADDAADPKEESADEMLVIFMPASPLLVGRKSAGEPGSVKAARTYATKATHTMTANAIRCAHPMRP